MLSLHIICDLFESIIVFASILTIAIFLYHINRFLGTGFNSYSLVQKKENFMLEEDNYTSISSLDQADQMAVVVSDSRKNCQQQHQQQCMITNESSQVISIRIHNNSISIVTSLNRSDFEELIFISPTYFYKINIEIEEGQQKKEIDIYDNNPVEASMFLLEILSTNRIRNFKRPIKQWYCFCCNYFYYC